MKEIKAYIRLDKADDVIFELEHAGVKGLTVIDVSAVGAGQTRKNPNSRLSIAKNIAAARS